MSYLWQELEEIYAHALELDPADRLAYIDKTCSHNEALRADLIAMIKSEDDADNYFMGLQESVANSFNVQEEKPLPPGTLIDKYAISHQLGRGGMGTVYLADRVDGQFDQKVAIKIFAHLNWSKAHDEHFRKEQQILASLNHPGIAQIYDGGFIREEGTAYFVMEYVDGIPIDQYVRKHKLSLRKRLAFFKAICRALAYAHRNFVLHMDIKPNNILVTEEGHIKLLDFGISNLLNESETSNQVMGTPSIASPEQWQGAKAGITSDIYQLGILLYTVLSDEQQTKQGASTKTISVARHATSNASGLINEVKADLALPNDIKNIITRSLAENPSSRYQSATGLHDDIERYENHFPVQATGRGRFYWFGKYIKRNKLAVISVATVMLVLMVSSIVSMQQAKIAKQERDKAEQVAAFLKSIFSATNPYVNENELTANELLKRGAKDIEAQQLPASTRAEFMSIIGDLYKKLGYWEDAAPYYRKTYRILLQQGLENDLLFIQTLSDLAGVYRDQSEFEKADSLFHRTVEAISELSDLENASFLMADALGDRAQVNGFMGNYDDAMKYVDEAIEMADKLNDQSLNAGLFNNKASILRSLSKYEEAKKYQLKAIEATMDEADRQMLNICYNNMGIICKKLADYELAEQYFLKNLNFEVENLNADHPSIATSLSNLGGVYYKMKAYDRADSVFRKALNIFLKQFDPKNDRVISTRYNLANVALNRNNFEQALHQYKAVLKADTATLGKMHPFVGDDYASIGKCYTFLGEFDKAKRAYDQTMRIYKSNFDKSHQKISYAQSLYAGWYEQQKHYDQAAEYYKKAYEHALEHLGDDHPYTKRYLKSWKENKKRSAV